MPNNKYAKQNLTIPLSCFSGIGSFLKCPRKRGDNAAEMEVTFEEEKKSWRIKFLMFPLGEVEIFACEAGIKNENAFESAGNSSTTADNTAKLKSFAILDVFNTFSCQCVIEKVTQSISNERRFCFF